MQNTSSTVICTSSTTYGGLSASCPNIGLFCINGKPAVAYWGNTSTHIVYQYASDSTGSSWSSPLELFSAYSPPTQSPMNYFNIDMKCNQSGYPVISIRTNNSGVSVERVLIMTNFDGSGTNYIGSPYQFGSGAANSGSTHNIYYKKNNTTNEIYFFSIFNGPYCEIDEYGSLICDQVKRDPNWSKSPTTTYMLFGSFQVWYNLATTKWYAVCFCNYGGVFYQDADNLTNVDSAPLFTVSDVSSFYNAGFKQTVELAISSDGSKLLFYYVAISGSSPTYTYTFKRGELSNITNNAFSSTTVINTFTGPSADITIKYTTGCVSIGINGAVYVYTQP